MDEVARVVVALEAPEVVEEVLHFLDRSGRARVVATAVDDRQLAEAVRQCEPDAIVAEPALATRLDGVPLLAVATRESVGALRAAVRAGADGFFVWPGEREQLLEGVAGSAAVRRVPERRATILAVHASRGGAGCTFVATHLAEAIRRAERRCVLVDVDPSFDDVAVALGAAGQGSRTLADLAPVAGELLWRHVEEVLVEGALLAPPPGAPVSDHVVEAAVRVAASEADVVVLHVPRTLDDRARWCFREADRIVEVLALDVAAFHSLERAREALLDDGFADRIEVVVNRSSRSDLSPGDVHRAFGVDPCAVIPSDPAVLRAQERGRVLGPRGRTSRIFDRLAFRLAPTGEAVAS